MPQKQKQVKSSKEQSEKTREQYKFVTESHLYLTKKGLNGNDPQLCRRHPDKGDDEKKKKKLEKWFK